MEVGIALSFLLILIIESIKIFQKICVKYQYSKFLEFG